MKCQIAGNAMENVQFGLRFESQLPPYLGPPTYTPVDLEMAALVHHADSVAVSFAAPVEACFADMPYTAAADECNDALVVVSHVNLDAAVFVALAAEAFVECFVVAFVECFAVAFAALAAAPHAGLTEKACAELAADRDIATFAA